MGSMYDTALDMERVTEGVKIDLLDSDGNLSGEWIAVRSAHSPQFEKALEETQQAMRDDAGADVSLLKLQCQVALVASWSFDEECTPGKVEEYLQIAPHIAKRIDRAAGNTNLFFMKRKPSSLNGQKPKSPSRRKRKVRTKQSANI